MTDSLYREAILDHYRNPRNRGTLDPANFSYEDVNPLCGDEIRIDVRTDGERVTDVRFSGRGCAISQAAASILMEMVEGQPLMDRLGLVGTARASFYVYNDDEDVDRLVSGLHRARAIFAA